MKSYCKVCKIKKPESKVLGGYWPECLNCWTMVRKIYLQEIKSIFVYAAKPL